MATARPRPADGVPSWRASATTDLDLDTFPVFPRRPPPGAGIASPRVALPAAASAVAVTPVPTSRCGRDLRRLCAMLAIPVLSLTALTVWATAAARTQTTTPASTISANRSALVNEAVALARDVERLRTTRRREQMALDALRRRTAEARLELDRLERQQRDVPPRPAPNVSLPQRLSAAPIAVEAAPPRLPPPSEALAAAPPPVNDSVIVPVAVTPARIVIHHTRGGRITLERVRSLAAALEQRAIGVTSMRPVDFEIARTSIRYFFTADAERAADLHWLTQEVDPVARDGAIEQPQDFTHYRPLPREGTIEIWLAS